MLGLATLIVHDDHATVTRKLGPARDLTSGWFGEQKTYFHKVGVELIAGIELAAKTLEQAPPGLDRVILVDADRPRRSRDRDAQARPRARPDLRWFGEQKTYFHKVGVELIAIELAAKTLEQAPLGLDLVLGDGCETNQKTAKQRLDKLGPPHRAVRDPDRDPSPPTGPRGSPGSIASSLTLGASHMTRGPGVPVLRNTAHFHLCRVEA